MTVVDAHAHVWAPEAAHDWVDPVLPAGAERLVYTVENYRGDMADLGVDRAVLVATPIHGPGSPYTLACLDRYPETFRGIVTVDTDADPDALAARTRSLLAREGVAGVRLGADEVEQPEAFWEAVAAADGQVQFLVPPERLAAVESVAAARPGVTFVVDHLGLRDLAGYSPAEPPYARMADLGRLPNVHAKVTFSPSGERYPFADLEPVVEFLLDAFGADRLLWGSNWVYLFKRALPWQTREWVDELDALSTADRRKLLGRNAERLFF